MTDRRGEDEEFSFRNGGGEREGHDQGNNSQGQCHGWGHWNQGYRRGAGAKTDAYLELWWSEERLGGSKGLVRGQGIRSITISYALPRSGGRASVICWWWRSLFEAEAKREVGANYEEVK